MKSSFCHCWCLSVYELLYRTKTVCVIDVCVDLTLGLRPVLLDQAVSTASVSESVCNCCYLSFWPPRSSAFLTQHWQMNYRDWVDERRVALQRTHSWTADHNNEVIIIHQSNLITNHHSVIGSASASEENSRDYVVFAQHRRIHTHKPCRVCEHAGRLAPPTLNAGSFLWMNMFKRHLASTFNTKAVLWNITSLSHVAKLHLVPQ